MEIKKPHKLSDFGEFGLINHLTKDFKATKPTTVLGVGDDCAVLEYNETHFQLITTDLLTEGIHFKLNYSPLKHLGYKAVVVNLSDIYAMGGAPTQIVVSLCISSKFSKESLELLYAGIKLACEKYNVDMVGGDISSSLTGMTISITALGLVEKDRIFYRNGAQNNDLICVTGDLGAAYLGLQILERELTVFEQNKELQPDLHGYDYVLERQLKPEARKDIVPLLASKGITPTSMIDISDGLSSEILHICEQSDTGCRIYEDKMPIDHESMRVAEEFNMSGATAALNGGEDYELLFTVPLTDFEKLKSIPEISIIGHMIEKSKGRRIILQDGSETEIIAQGWQSIN